MYNKNIPILLIMYVATMIITDMLSSSSTVLEFMQKYHIIKIMQYSPYIVTTTFVIIVISLSENTRKKFEQKKLEQQKKDDDKLEARIMSKLNAMHEIIESIEDILLGTKLRKDIEKS